MSLADAVAGLDTKKPREKPKRRRKKPKSPPLPPIVQDATRTAWPAATIQIFTSEASYKSGKTVAVAGHADGSVVCRWPRGGVSVASDAQCLRCFCKTGQLALVADARGAVAARDVMEGPYWRCMLRGWFQGRRQGELAPRRGRRRETSPHSSCLSSYGQTRARRRRWELL